jgi:hypothetical protein
MEIRLRIFCVQKHMWLKIMHPKLKIQAVPEKNQKLVFGTIFSC